MTNSNIFFIDRDLGRGFGSTLRTAGFAVEDHDTHFPDKPATDVEWVLLVAKRRWFAVTRDKRIRYNRDFTDMAMRKGAWVFILTGKAKHSELANNFIATMPRIARFITKHPGAFIAKVYRPTPTSGDSMGSVQLRLDLEEWLRSCQ